MSSFYKDEKGVTRCSECKRELRTPEEWSQCQSNHTLQRLAATPEGRRYIEMFRPHPLK